MAITVVGLSGSLRRASLNTALLRAAAAEAPVGMAVEVVTLHGVPLYDGDLEVAEGVPPAVQALAETIAAADAVLIASPEYNYSLPGVLKNALDWVSRVPNKALAGKPVAITGASPGRWGTARMQYQLRHALLFSDARVLNKPELMVSQAGSLFDDAGVLVDEPTKKHLRALLEALAATAAHQRLAT